MNRKIVLSIALLLFILGNCSIGIIRNFSHNGLRSNHYIVREGDSSFKPQLYPIAALVVPDKRDMRCRWMMRGMTLPSALRILLGAFIAEYFKLENDPYSK